MTPVWLSSVSTDFWQPHIHPRNEVATSPSAKWGRSKNNQRLISQQAMPQLTRDQNCLQSTIFPRLSSKQFHGSVAQKQNFNVYLGVSVIYMQIDGAVNVWQNNTINLKFILKVSVLTTHHYLSMVQLKWLRWVTSYISDLEKSKYYPWTSIGQLLVDKPGNKYLMANALHHTDSLSSEICVYY